jgi:hypothetical protein
VDLSLILVIVLILVLFGVLPTWGYSRGWGYGPSGLLGLVLLVLVIWIIFGGLARAADLRGRRMTMVERRCAELYIERNSFFNRRGLCFTRSSAIRLFPDNPRTCRFETSEELPISLAEKTVIDGIVDEERSLGCPRL